MAGTANPQEAEAAPPGCAGKGPAPPAAWRLSIAKGLQLRHQEDIRTLGIVAFTYGLFITRWACRGSALPLLMQAAWWWANALFAFFCATIVHNCVHVPLFKERWQNNTWQVVLSLSYGFPVSTLIPGHNLSHHKHTQGPKDVIRTTKMRWGYNLLNLLFFIPTVTPSIQKQDIAYMQKQREKRRPIYRQACREVLAVVLVNVSLLVWNWQMYVMFVFLPQAFAKVSIISINLPQHDGCPKPEEDKYNFARNFTGPILNYLTCNNGYHTIHHMYPGMHWSILKQEHDRQVLPHIHPSLDQPDLLWYLFVTYVLPGGRVMYDGSPYKVMAPEKDEPWYSADVTETYSDSKDM